MKPDRKQILERKQELERQEEQEPDSWYSVLQNSYDEVLQPLVEKLPIAPQLRVPLVLVILMVFFFGGLWYGLKGVNESKNAKAWQQLFQVALPPSSEMGANSTNYDRLNDFIVEQKAEQSSWIYMVPLLTDNTNVIAWATVKQANLALAIGINNAYQANKDEAKKKTRRSLP